MQRLWIVCIAVLLVGGMATSAMGQAVQLDITGGFNFDVWCGALEFQAVMEHARDYWGIDLIEMQGGLAQGVHYDFWGGGNLMVSNTTEEGFAEPYSIEGAWYHPSWKTGDAGAPEDGVISGADRDYHVASHLGNATLAGDWTEPGPGDDWSYGPGGLASGDGIDVKFNSMICGSGHSTASWQVAEIVAELPGGQKGPYNNINMILAAFYGDRARNMQIVAMYGADGSDEEVLHAFSIEDGGSGPRVMYDDGGADFAVVYSMTQAYNAATGSTGSVRAKDGNLYEFASPVPLDPGKNLWGIKIVDVNPSLMWNSRGLGILAATAYPAGTPGDPDADLSTVTADPLLIPDDESEPSVITIALNDENYTAVTGLATDIVISVSGGGTSTISAVSEVSTGVYEADFTNDTAGLKEIHVTVDMAPAGAGPEDIALSDAPVVDVYTPGVSGPPLADAGADQIVEDTDESGDENVDLDGSASVDGDGTIDNYSWTEGGIEITTGVTPTVLLAQGAHLITLTCTDNDGYTGSDDVWVIVQAPGGDPDAVQLKIDSGFTQDCLWGAYEMKAILWYSVLPDPDLDGAEAQGSCYQNYQAGWGVFGPYDGHATVTNNTVDTYTTFNQWWHPDYISGDEGFPETGYVAGTQVDYFMPGSSGNPIMPENMICAADDLTLTAQLGPGGYACGNGMDVKLNTMAVGSAHGTGSFQIADTTALLPAGQQDQYAGVNVVLCAFRGGGERGRYMRLAALYTDDSEEIIYAWPDDGTDDTPWSDEMNAAHPDYNLIVSNTQMYSPGSGSTGGIGNDDEALYEFASFLALDDTKTLKGLRLYDSNPTVQYQTRGIAIYAATAVYDYQEADPPEVSVATEDGLAWVYQNIPASVANGGHKVALTVTVIALNGNNTVTVTVTKQAASGPGEVTVQPGATDLEKLIHGSDRTAGTNGALVLDVSCQGDICPTPTVVAVPFSCNIIGDVDGNGGAEPTDVSLLINKLNGLGNGGFHDKAFDLDANGGPEPGDVSILINVLNGLL